MLDPISPRVLTKGALLSALMLFASKDDTRGALTGYAHEFVNEQEYYAATNGRVAITVSRPAEGAEDMRTVLSFPDKVQPETDFPNCRRLFADFRKDIVAAQEMSLVHWAPLSRVLYKYNNETQKCPPGFDAKFGLFQCGESFVNIPLGNYGLFYKALRLLHGKHSSLPCLVSLCKEEKSDSAYGMLISSTLACGWYVEICCMTSVFDTEESINLYPETVSALAELWDDYAAKRRAERAAKMEQFNQPL